MTLHELTASVRRFAGRPQAPAAQNASLVRVGDVAHESVDSAHADLGSLRGVTPAAADTADCMCPEHCERDHANE